MTANILCFAQDTDDQTTTNDLLSSDSWSSPHTMKTFSLIGASCESSPEITAQNAAPNSAF